MGTGSSFRSKRRVVAGSYQTWSLVPAKRGTALSLSTESASVREHTATAWLQTRPQPRATPAVGLERVRVLFRHFEMISGDFEVQETDASMDGLEEAAGKFELSPELNGDARDTMTGCGPSFPLSSSHGMLAVPKQAASVLDAAGSSDTPVVMGAVVQRAARRPKTSCEQCRMKRMKCSPACPTLAAEPMALMPLSAGGEPSAAQASSASTRRVSSRDKSHRNAYPESSELREWATGKRRVEGEKLTEENFSPLLPDLEEALGFTDGAIPQYQQKETVHGTALLRRHWSAHVARHPREV